MVGTHAPASYEKYEENLKLCPPFFDQIASKQEIF